MRCQGEEMISETLAVSLFGTPKGTGPFESASDLSRAITALEDSPYKTNGTRSIASLLYQVLRANRPCPKALQEVTLRALQARMKEKYGAVDQTIVEAVRRELVYTTKPATKPGNRLSTAHLKALASVETPTKEMQQLLVEVEDKVGFPLSEATCCSLLGDYLATQPA